MPSLADFKPASIRMLFVGKPGAGKTGSLVSELIANPKARFFIANYDGKNIGTLVSVIREDPVTKQPRDPALVRSCLSRVFYHDLRDKIQPVNGIPLVVGTPTGFMDFGKKLNDWGDGLGGLNSWGPDDWLVIDSFSQMGETALRYSLNLASRLNKRPEQQDWGDAINRLMLILELITADTVKANVCVITHVRYIGDMEAGKDEKTGRPKEFEALPNALGQKLPQEIGRYFNNILLADTQGEGMGLRRKLFTQSPSKLVTRSSNPAAVKPSYDLATGFAEYVRDLRRAAASPPETPAAAPAAPVSPATPSA